MKTHDCYRLHITPLSPVHIGTGESYEPTHYVIEDGILHEFDSGALLQALLAKDREELLTLGNRKPDAEMLKAFQRFFHERRERLKPWAVNRIPVLDGVANLYLSRVGQTAQREGDGGQVLNKLEIDRTAFDPITRKPVLFGSSLKGAMRTALLDQLNNSRPLSDRDAELFQLEGLPEQEQKRRRREQRRVFPRLNERLLQFQAGKFELDPFRLVQIGDARWRGNDDLPSSQVHFAVNRKKALVRDKNGNERKSQAENQDLCRILECIPSWQYRGFTAHLNIQKLGRLPDDPSKRRLPTPDLRLSLEELAKRCSKFYIPILKSEIKLLKDRGFLDASWEESISRLLEAASRNILEGKAFLLRIGRHSGAESVTLNGVRNIKILKGNPEFQSAPKTLWLAAERKDQRQGLLPFGWLLVEVEPLDAPERDWPELKALCEPHLQAMRTFASKLAREADKREKARAEAERRRQEETEAARQQAEAKAQAEREAAERAARLAAMTDNMRRAEELKSQLTPASKGRGKGHQLYQQVNQLIRSATAWPPEEQAVLRAAAVAAFEHLGLKKDDYKKLVRDLAVS
jgi:CRISPR-associated protein Csm5